MCNLCDMKVYWGLLYCDCIGNGPKLRDEKVIKHF